LKFTLYSPCPQCPFLKTQGYLSKARAKEIGSMMASTSGGSFPCHKTTKHDDEVHCAGALLFMEKVNEGATQTVRIAERLGMYDKSKLTGADTVYDSVSKMVRGHGGNR
jgi:hypothetical protein